MNEHDGQDRGEPLSASGDFSCPPPGRSAVRLRGESHVRQHLSAVTEFGRDNPELVVALHLMRTSLPVATVEANENGPTLNAQLACVQLASIQIAMYNPRPAEMRACLLDAVATANRMGSLSPSDATNVLLAAAETSGSTPANRVLYELRGDIAVGPVSAGAPLTAANVWPQIQHGCSLEVLAEGRDSAGEVDEGGPVETPSVERGPDTATPSTPHEAEQLLGEALVGAPGPYGTTLGMPFDSAISDVEEVVGTADTSVAGEYELVGWGPLMLFGLDNTFVGWRLSVYDGFDPATLPDGAAPPPLPPPGAVLRSLEAAFPVLELLYTEGARHAVYAVGVTDTTLYTIYTDDEVVSEIRSGVVSEDLIKVVTFRE